MTNTDILTTLAKAEIKTIGDLDHYASIRRISRWHALAQLIGEEGADRVLGLLAVRLSRAKQSLQLAPNKPTMRESCQQDIRATRRID